MKILHGFYLVVITATLSLVPVVEDARIKNNEIKEPMLTNLSLYPLKKGIYQHYRNKKYYEVIGVGRHSETLEPMVVYRALYDELDIWVRPYAMFIEHVNEPQYEGPRFIFISEQAGDEFLKALNK